MAVFILSLHIIRKNIQHENMQAQKNIIFSRPSFKYIFGSYTTAILFINTVKWYNANIEF